MPSFEYLDKLEVFMQAGTFPEGASLSSRRSFKGASKRFVYEDGVLWRPFRGRVLRVVRSNEEVRDILTRYHDNNNHAGRGKVVQEITSMYYLNGVSRAVKKWIAECPLCQSNPANPPKEQPDRQVRFCLAYGCDASSYRYPELSFHRFPKQAETRQRWLAVAQRDEGSVRRASCLCSRHFEPSCFTPSEEGQLVLSADAVPTIIPVTAQEDRVPPPSDEDFLQSGTLEDFLSTAAAEAFDASEPDLSQTRSGLQEHQYCLPAPDLASAPELRESKRKMAIKVSSFVLYNQIARYLSHRVLPMQSPQSRSSLKRKTKRFSLTDGVLMYKRASSVVRVPRSREEVDSILKQFHDNQGHPLQGVCQQEISKHFYWANLSQDLGRWIARCPACLSRAKSKSLRCSVANCTTCCGPVERGLGLTFHNFPHHNAALLAQWLKAVGRPNWYPRLGSSICSTHFTEECYDCSGEEVALRPDAVPTLLVHSDSAAPSRGPALAAVEEAYFAKYDAVELYLSRRTYPPGLTYVEKNTFRRFCKKFTMKDGELHVVQADRVCLVLRSRQQVEAALVDYHNELNHLDAKKCLRLLNERCFWKTMKTDVGQWINSCSLCSSKKRRKPEPAGPEWPPESLQIDDDSGREDHEEEEEEEEGAEEGQPATEEDVITLENPNQPQPRIPTILKSWTPLQSEVHQEANGLMVQVEQTGPRDREQTSGSARTLHCGVSKPLSQSRPPPELLRQPSSQSRGLNDTGKRKRDLQAGSSGKRSSKPRPVGPVPGSARASPELDGPAAVGGPGSLQARAVIQQCSRAKVQTKPGRAGAEAQWAEIQEGMVVFVCFFHGAAEDVAHQMADTLMTSKLFRRGGRRVVSLLDLPGSLLLIPQDSLGGKPVRGRRVQLQGLCEQWRGAQLFSVLAAACRELMFSSAKCREAGVAVEQGVYGPRQEMVLDSLEPLTLLLEF